MPANQFSKLKRVVQGLMLVLALTFSFATQSLAAGDACADIFSSAKTDENFLLASLLNRVSSDAKMQVGVKPLVHGAEALAAKLELIDRAQSTIDLTYYIFKRDRSGYAILDALKRAIERGVHVRLMVDGIGSFHPTLSHFEPLFELNKKFADSRVEVKVINPILSIRHTFFKLFDFIKNGRWNFNLGAVNNRSHDKILLIDAGKENSWAVIGGRNIGDDYYGLNGHEKEIVDYEVLLKSGADDRGKDSLEIIESHFEALFANRLNMSLTSKFWRFKLTSPENENGKMQNASDEVSNFEEVARQLEKVKNEKYWSEGFDTVDSVFASEIQNILYENRSFDTRAMVSVGKQVGLSKSAFDVMKDAKKSIELVSPYAIFAKQDIVRMKAWLLKNPEATVALYTNSRASTDNILAYGIFRYITLPRLRKLQAIPQIGSRIQIHLYSGPGLLHAKLLTVDEQLTLITTSNLDPRSRIYNSEIGIWQDSRRNQNEVETLRERIIANSVALDTVEKPASNLNDRIKEIVLKYLSYTFEKIGLSSQF